MIAFTDPEDCAYAWKVFRFARANGLWKQLRGQLEYLRDYATGEGALYDKAKGCNTRCVLFPDFAPHSFNIWMQKREPGDSDWRHFFRGGLIYQGPTSPANGGAPSFTVSLVKGTGWFVNT